MKGIGTMRHASATVLAPAMLVLLVGCASGPQPFPMVIEPSSSLRGSILVDVIGANKSDLSDWESCSVTKYFQPGNPKRQDADKVTFHIEPGVNTPYRLEVTDEIWNRWKHAGVDHLVVMADLPTVAEDGPRRKILSLNPDDYPDAKELEVEIQQSGVRVLTRQRTGR